MNTVAILNCICTCLSITIMTSCLLIDRKSYLWHESMFVCLNMLYRLIFGFFPALYFFLIHILAGVPFLIFLQEGKGLVPSIFKTVIAVGFVFLVIIFWGGLFQLLTPYIPHIDTTYDIGIGVMIVLTCIAFKIWVSSYFKYAFSLSFKSQKIITALFILYILFFTLLHPMLYYFHSEKLYSYSSLITVSILILSIGISFYSVQLENNNDIKKALTFITNEKICALLYQKYLIASLLEDIHVNLSIKSPITDLYMNEMSLFKLLSIILDNAIEELSYTRTQERKTMFMQLSIEIENRENTNNFVVRNTINPNQDIEHGKNGHFGKCLSIARRIEKQYRNLEIYKIANKELSKDKLMRLVAGGCRLRFLISQIH